MFLRSPKSLIPMFLKLPLPQSAKSCRSRFQQVKVGSEPTLGSEAGGMHMNGAAGRDGCHKRANLENWTSDTPPIRGRSEEKGWHREAEVTLKSEESSPKAPCSSRCSEMPGKPASLSPNGFEPTIH